MDADGRIPGQGLWLKLRVRSTLREGEKKKKRNPHSHTRSDSQFSKKTGHYDIVARKFKLGILAV